MKLYVVIAVEGYVPQVLKVTKSRDEAMRLGKEDAGEWMNGREQERGEIYFNQEEEGNMENATSVSEVEVEGVMEVK